MLLRLRLLLLLRLPELLLDHLHQHLAVHVERLRDAGVYRG
jgi:hypothetical protein